MNAHTIFNLAAAAMLSLAAAGAPLHAQEGPGSIAGGEQPMTLQEASAARSALDQLVRAYERGDVAAVRSALDPAMIGYQRFLDGVQQDFSALKQIRVHLLEVQVTAGPDVAAIQLAWEKRFFTPTDSRPGLFRGRTLLLMHRAASGWKLAAIAGDDPFSSQSGTLARLDVGASSFSRALLAPCTVPCNLPMRIELVDPDLAGMPSVSVEVRTSQGDIETVALTPAAPGHFVRNTLTFVLSPTPAAYSGAVNIGISAAPITLTFRYVDRDPGAGRPPSTLVRTVSVVP